MLTIRFARVGKKNKAQFKIMLQEKSMAPGDFRFLRSSPEKSGFKR